MWRLLDFPDSVSDDKSVQGIFDPSMQELLYQNRHDFNGRNETFHSVRPVDQGDSSEMVAIFPQWLSGESTTLLREREHNRFSNKQPTETNESILHEGASGQTFMDLAFDSLPMLYDSVDPDSIWWDSGML